MLQGVIKIEYTLNTVPVDHPSEGRRQPSISELQCPAAIETDGVLAGLRLVDALGIVGSSISVQKE
jgi:hypothetical protein